MEIEIVSKKHGKFIMLIDKEDYDKLENKSISITRCGNKFYAQDSKRNRIHQLVGGKKEGMMVDHINRNTLDNRKCNLRLVDRSTNGKNRDGYGSIKYKFISKHTRYDRKNPRTLYSVKFPNLQHRQFTNKNEAYAYYLECLFDYEGGL